MKHLWDILPDTMSGSLAMLFDYLDTRDRAMMVDNVFRAAYSSVACLAIFTVQDILKLGNEARMNMPFKLWK